MPTSYSASFATTWIDSDSGGRAGDLMSVLKSKLAQGVVVLLAVAILARIIFTLLQPLLAPLAVLLLVGGLIVYVLRGPRTGGGLFHK